MGTDGTAARPKGAAKNPKGGAKKNKKFLKDY